MLTNYSDNPRPALKPPGYPTTPDESGWKSPFQRASWGSRGGSPPGGPKAD
ncbi:MAG: hypothetical protein HUU38_02080 [Anaerolineales bacterium]|nr:hypothetical protein [Anaerolineales bacterium]